MQRLVLFCLFSVTLAGPLSNDRNVVWFPDPASNDPTDLIPAYLTHPAGHVQVATDLSKAHFLLYTRENPEIPDELFVGDTESLSTSHFIANGNVKFMSHGFGGAVDHFFPWNVTEEFLNTAEPDLNIILLDWAELSSSPDYVGAVTNAYAVSNLTAELLEFLLEQEVTTLDKLHLIGYSLGGQVVGITGNRFTRRTGKIIPRITALDPAFPLFDIAIEDDRISPDDATFVDVIHTAGGTLGMVQARGHIDFYPNGGIKQPGCGPDIVGSCAHGRAPAYFKESVLGTVPFKAVICENWEEYSAGNCADAATTNMGYHVDQTARGKYYLRTEEEEPYAQG